MKYAALALSLLFVVGCDEAPPTQAPAPSSAVPLAKAESAAKAAAADVGLCAGYVSDKLPRAMEVLPLPPKGVTFVDPAFGGRVTRITDVDPAEGENAIIKPMYSTIQAWSPFESYLILWHRGVGWELYNGETYEFLEVLDLQSPSDIEHVLWDPWDERYLYYPSNWNLLQRIMRHNVETNVSEVWMDLDAMGLCAAGTASVSLGGDPSGASFMLPGLAVASMHCGNRYMFVELKHKVVSDLLSVEPPPGRLVPFIAPYGQVAFLPTYGTHTVDVLFNIRRPLGAFLGNGHEHGSIGTARTAMDAWYSVVFDPPLGLQPATLQRLDLNTGTVKVIVGEANGWPYPPSGTHISAMSRDLGRVAVSMVGDPAVAIAGTAPLHQEIVLANSDTGEVCRVAHHRSAAGSGSTGWGYWGEPHLGLSPTGNRIVFGSDWHKGSAVNTFVVDLR